ncbi:hypothetical protein GCK72_021060 [Caenorhabditis remanei]|uniref:F-box domain-containing protein n=1 Tax=Caenorhabditis remanei TaxID=31234 RepID=A0A6A5GGZ1_CAERE|nr:hypothetical protein GCK72_021060 [Caenorhabditis remanei]KAF1754497.1 hypothetical protein GCK72_021060 [Caenorhabditis remanei]
MVNVTDKGPLVNRRRILEEFGKVQTQIATNPNAWRSVAFRVYKRICKAMGDDYVDYPEFEFWFSRFVQGNFDLNYDRCSDPKARSIIDLPLDVFNKIGEYLKLEDRFQLRNVCKDIRYQVDNWDLKLDEIFYNGANEWRITPTLGPGPFFSQNVNNRFYRDPNSFVMNILKLPKLQVEKLTIYKQDECWEKFIRVLNESNRKLLVKKVQFPCFYPSKIDLHFMIPGVLEEIKLFIENPKRKEIIEIVESEQCQKAKMVYIDSPTVISKFPLDALYNCPRFTLQLGKRPADGLKSKFLKTLMNEGKVQKCVLYVSNYVGVPSQIMNYFNEPEAMVPNFPLLRRYPIPGTNEFYELEDRVELSTANISAKVIKTFEMAEVTDPMETRKLILTAFRAVQIQIAANPEIWRELSFEVHKELFEELGDDFVDYPEFEFWFSRFLQGNFDLNYDKSSDPKARSLTDLPLEVFNKIGENLKIKNKLQLRDVCKDFRFKVDNWDFKVMTFCYKNENDWKIFDGGCRIGLYQNPISFFMNMLKLPKFQLEKLTIYREDEYWKKLIEELDESNQKLPVRKVKVEFPFIRSSKIDLHFLVPEVLEEISVIMKAPSFEVINEFIKSDQCQAAKMVSIETNTCTSEFPLKALYNCLRFTLQIDNGSADKLKAEFIKELIRIGKVEWCRLDIANYTHFFNRYHQETQFLKHFNEENTMVPDNPLLRRIPIPKTNEFYELEYREEYPEGNQVDFVRLERKQFERDPLAIRRRILEEFEKVQTQIKINPESWRKLIFEAHKELCKELGANFMDYPEFEFGFLRFLRGNFDWGYDRRSDPKAPSITDLPFEGFNKIGANLELHDRFQLRNVCKDIRAQVDSWDPKVTEISYIDANNWNVWQSSRPEPYCVDIFGQNENSRCRPGFYQNPISFLMNVLGHPKLRVEKLTIHEQDEYWEKLIRELDESNRKIHVKNVEFPNRHYQSTINLNYMIPGVLEEIKIYLANSNHREIIEMIKSEQCQSAKMVYIESPKPTSKFPLDALYNCPRFTLRVGKVLKSRLMEYGEVEKCVLYISNYIAAPSQIMKYFNELEAMVPNFPSLRRYRIPGTNEFYELEYQGDSVRLERKQ